MKATAVQAKQEVIETKACVECHRPLQAPWGRVDKGKNWVCSKNCDDLHRIGMTHNMATIKRLTGDG